MRIPYQCVTTLGESAFFCAAKGASLHTFELGAAPQLLSSWSHPSLKQAEKKSQEVTLEDEKSTENDTTQPPSKKRKISSVDEPVGSTEAAQPAPATPDAPANGAGQKKQKFKHAPKPEIAFVILLTATSDGSHVVAVTGQDKTIWVFAHDGKGGLTELSQRQMPKRPSSIALADDDKTILCADKFGDVYGLPLIPSATTTTTEEAAASASPTPTPAPAPARPEKGANTLTVHSQRNLRALENQKRHLAEGKGKGKGAAAAAFAHDLLLLGHVSMLCAVAAARDAEGRPYILTGDRDEHVRVSRGRPGHAHVVEAYCLGHAAFVGALRVPAARPARLLSAGGDPALFLWDWRRGALLARADLLARVREVVPGAARVAVTALRDYATADDGGCYVAVLCEGVPAIFIYQLGAASLMHVSTQRLGGNPLDLAFVKAADGGAHQHLMIAGLDAPDSLAVFALENPTTTTWRPRASVPGVAHGDCELSRAELDALLYTTENLRKTEMEDAGGDNEGDGKAPPAAADTVAAQEQAMAVDQ
ncbi:hypothetical protein F4780DRAFT_777887 [Xylariomycetidae sp. FL0641]|nr:hypothetical protein F4780DRAFT_777887 [Xylariomycetidae sp. FL0641]